MSTIDVANLSDAESTTTNSANSSDTLNNTTTVDTKYITNGSSKAWCRISTDASIQSSLNISSVTDVGSGNRDFNFNSDYTSATSWNANGSSYYNSSAGTGAFFDTIDAQSSSASKVRITHYQNGSGIDRPMHMTSHGELA